MAQWRVIGNIGVYDKYLRYWAPGTTPELKDSQAAKLRDTTIFAQVMVEPVNVNAGNGGGSSLGVDVELEVNL